MDEEAKPRATKYTDQGLNARKGQSQDLNLDLLLPMPRPQYKAIATHPGCQLPWF